MDGNNNNCQFIEGCKFYKFLKEKRPELLDSMGRLYCHNLWSRCQRFIHRTAGETVPDEMWPTGLRPKATV